MAQREKADGGFDRIDSSRETALSGTSREMQYQSEE